jgi:holo-[acyl-carrier protein] synthase
MDSIIGIGTDVVDVERVRAALGRHGRRFVARAFTDAEAGYCDVKADPALHFAGRFAAKEAVLKALGTGWSRGVGWRDVEVEATAGAPAVRLWGRAAEIARDRGVEGPVLLSISHDRAMAVAFAVLQGTAAPSEDRP